MGKYFINNLDCIAIEQANLTAKDTFSTSNLEQSNPLPNLLKNSTISAKNRGRSEKDTRININTLQTRGFDILYIKRLMYLKDSIDDDKHIAKIKRDHSNENAELSNPNLYSQTMSSALLSLKPAENVPEVSNDDSKTLIDQRNFSNYQSSNSPLRIKTAEKPGSRRDRLKRTAQNNLSQYQQKARQTKNTFVTQAPLASKSRTKANRTVVGDIRKTGSNIRLNASDTQQDDMSMIDKIKHNKFMTGKDEEDIKAQKQSSKPNDSRNNVSEYWKTKPLPIDNKTYAMYKSSENLVVTDHFMPEEQFKAQQHDIFKKYVHTKVDE